MLGMLMARYPRSVAVSGTHGKTTTTGMLTQILLAGNLDPSAVIGGKLPLTGTNGRAGKSDALVCEACEYVDTFLQLHPFISIILNVDSDHLDYFKNLENIIRSFHQFAKQTTGILIVNGDDENAMKAVEGITNARIITFGLKDSNDYRAANIADEPKALEDFSVLKNGKRSAKFRSAFPEGIIFLTLWPLSQRQMLWESRLKPSLPLSMRLPAFIAVLRYGEHSTGLL